jgi:hypothetical protein
MLSWFVLGCASACGSHSGKHGASHEDSGMQPVDADAGMTAEDAGSAPSGHDAATQDEDAGKRDASVPTDYDQLVLADAPVAYWAMNQAPKDEADLSGHDHTGTYQGGKPGSLELPNGDQAAAFDGVAQYLTVPSSPAFSITTTGELTWEAWINADLLQFPHDDGSGYVDWLGKCAEYAPSCEWEARWYSTMNDEQRCNRWSAYVFNPSAQLGSGADFQPACGLVKAMSWYHVVGEYSLETQPADCESTDTYPGSIDIWVNGTKWDHASHGQTGCFSQYQVKPAAADSPINIGTMALDTWFPGAIGKVAIYDKLLTQAQISAHFHAMTDHDPSGTCGDTCNDF